MTTTVQNAAAQPTARRRRNDAADTRELLIDAAAMLFRRRGFGTVTIDEICAAVKPPLSKGAYYHSFDSKQAVLFAILEKYMVEAKEFLESLEQSARNVPEQLDELFAHSGQMLKSLRPYVIVTILEQRHLSDEYAARAKQMRESYRRKVEGIIRRGQEDGSIIALDPKILALNYFAMLNWMYLWFDERGHLSADQVVSVCRFQFLRGVLVNPPPMSAFANIGSRASPKRRVKK